MTVTEDEAAPLELGAAAVSISGTAAPAALPGRLGTVEGVVATPAHWTGVI